MDKHQKLIKNTAIIAIGNICTKFISFFLLPLYTSLLTTQEYGTVDLISVFVTLLTGILTLQFELGVFRYLIEARQDKKMQRSYISTTIVAISGIAIIYMVLAFVAMLFIHNEYKYYVIINVVVNLYMAVFLQIARGLGKNLIYTIGSFISACTNIILNVVLIAVMHWNVDGMLLAGVISQLFTVIFVGMKCGLSEYLSYYFFDKTALKKLLSYSLPLIPNTLCWWLINASDRIIINIFLNVGMNGIYSVAQKFPTLFGNISNIFILSWTESAAENIDDPDRNRYFNQIMEKSINVFSSIALGIIGIMPFIFSFFVNGEFKEAYYQIPILLVAALFHTIGSLYGALYTAFKNTKSMAKTTIYSGIINVVVNVLLISYIGLYASSVSALVAYLVVIFLRHYELKKEVSLCYRGKFILQQIIMFCIAIFSYYYNNTAVSATVLLLIIIYSIYNNFELIRKLFLFALRNMNGFKLNRS